MPAKSASQRRLMAAADHGATFPKAQQLRKTMSHQQLHEFVVKPNHYAPTPRPPMKPSPKTTGHPHRNLGKYLHPRKSR